MCEWSLNATFCPFLGLCATADQLLRRFRRPLYTRVVGMENWRRGALTKPVSLAPESMGVSRSCIAEGRSSVAGVTKRV